MARLTDFHRQQRQTWCSGYWRRLEEAELPHHPVDGVLLDADVEDQSSPRHPVRLVSGAQGREPLWCAGSNHGSSVRHPPDLGIDHPVDLINEVLAGLLRLLPSPNVLQRTRKIK
jgi:hypothetical protein